MLHRSAKSVGTRSWSGLALNSSRISAADRFSVVSLKLGSGIGERKFGHPLLARLIRGNLDIVEFFEDLFSRSVGRSDADVNERAAHPPTPSTTAAKVTLPTLPIAWSVLGFGINLNLNLSSQEPLSSEQGLCPDDRVFIGEGVERLDRQGPGLAR